MANFSPIVCLILCLFYQTHGARILVVLPMPIWSHYLQFEPLFETLATRGHQMTVYSPFPPKINISNFHHIHVTLTKSKQFFESLNHFELKDNGTYGATNFLAHFSSTIMAFNYGLGMVEEIFSNPKIQDLMKSNDKYDLVFSEYFFGQEALIAFGNKFKAPVIGEASYGTPHQCFSLMGNPYLLSYMPDYKFAFPSRMDFLQRLQNTLLGIFTTVVSDWWYYPKQDEIMRKFFPVTNMPYLKTLLKNISVTFIYSDLMLEYQRAQISNLVHVGGIHLRNEKLPKDLDDIMNNSPKGVILVSFGSLIKPNRMSESMRSLLMEAFSKIGLTVLMRWEGEPIKNLPKNIILKSWIPQQDILAHPNCRLFISHGGINSVIETIHYGVPIVGVSFYNDQPNNIKHVIDLGAGVELSYFNITQESIVWAANTILNNPRYKRNAIAASKRFNDRQIPPLESAVWWVEYVLRHHGAPHLRSAYDDLSWTEFLLLDVLSFVLGVVLVVLYLLLRTGVFIKNLVVAPLRRKVKGE